MPNNSKHNWQIFGRLFGARPVYELAFSNRHTDDVSDYSLQIDLKKKSNCTHELTRSRNGLHNF